MDTIIAELFDLIIHVYLLNTLRGRAPQLGLQPCTGPSAVLGARASNNSYVQAAVLGSEIVELKVLTCSQIFNLIHQIFFLRKKLNICMGGKIYKRLKNKLN